MARHRETDKEYFDRTGELREDDWGAGETRPGVGEAFRDAAEDALADKIADSLIPDRKGRTQAERDAKDAGNADSAFNAILAPAVLYLNLAGAPLWFAAPPVSTAAAAVWSGLVTSAGIAVRVAWAKLSLQDRAKIWRGEI